MILLKPYKTLLIIGFSLILSVSYASDTAKEKRWADQIADSIMIGDAEWLKVGKSKIFSIFTEYTTEKAVGAAIILHGIGVHPNWDEIIRPLRSQLPDFGWSTLSIQLPVLANDAEYSAYAPLFNDIAPRIDAAVKFLKAKGINNIVVIGHSMGASMGAYYMSQKPDKSITAFVSVGSTGRMFKDPEKNYFKSLEKITVPTVDIYGAIDLPDVINSAKRKNQIAKKAGNKNYTQIKIAGANHFFSNKEEILIKRIRGWLNKNAPGTEIKK
jgi:pimeloyl-ACP methyl ester carboxylesterase